MLYDFFAMNGYGLYIWSSYGFAALALSALFTQSLRSYKRLARELEKEKHNE